MMPIDQIDTNSEDNDLPGLVNFNNLTTLPPIGESHQQYYQWMNSVMENIEDAVITVDIDGEITYMNRAAEAMTQWKKETALCRNLVEIITLMDEQTNRLIRSPAIKSIIKKQTIYLPKGTVLLRSDESSILVEGHAQPIFDNDGEIIGATFIFRDITEQADAKNLIFRLVQALKVACGIPLFNGAFPRFYK